MRKLALMVAQCLLLAGCTGLPRPREMGEMALLRTVGVDGQGSAVTLTVSTGERAGAGEGEKQPALVLSGSGRSLPAAALELRKSSDSYVFSGYADRVLLGSDADLWSVLGWFAQDDELSLGAEVWLLQGVTAARAVENGGEAGVEKRLLALSLDAGLGAAPMTRRLGEVYSALLDRGCTFLPVLTGEGELSPGGYALIKGWEVAATLAGEEARGLELLCEKPMAVVLETPLPENPVSIRLTGAQLDCKPRFAGGKLEKLELRCRVSAELCQWERVPTAREREEIAAEGGRQLARQISAALTRMGQAQTECVGIGSRVAMAAPWYWPDMEARWQEIFAAADWELDVRVSLD